MFAATNLVFGREFWGYNSVNNTFFGPDNVSDWDIKAGPGSSNPSNLIYRPGAPLSAIYFSADNGVVGPELYGTNLFATGSIKDINLGSEGSYPENISIGPGNNLLFSANTGANGRELWISHGVPGNGNLLKDIWTGSGGSFPRYFKNLEAISFFVAETSAEGAEIWKTDGTPVGTKLLRDIRAGRGDSNITSFVDAGSKVYFSADDGISGVELWRSARLIEASLNLEPVDAAMQTRMQMQMEYLIVSALRN